MKFNFFLYTLTIFKYFYNKMFKINGTLTIKSQSAINVIIINTYYSML